MEGAQSQSRRLSLKRPWEDVTLPEEGHGSLLTPIEAGAYRRTSLPHPGVFMNNRCGPGDRESVAKKARFESLDYNTFPQHFWDVGRAPQHLPAVAYPGHSEHRGSAGSLTAPRHRIAAEGPAESQESAILCSRCKKLATLENGTDSYSTANTCDKCGRNSELAYVTQTASSACVSLTNLAEKLRAGIPSEERGIIRSPEERKFGAAEYPPIARFNLKQKVDWILNRINQCNYMVDDLVKHVPAGAWKTLNKHTPQDGTRFQDAPLDIMKRRSEVDSEDAYRARMEAAESSDAKAHTRRRSVTTGPLASEDITALRPQSHYHTSLRASDDQSPRVSIMNPPPAPNRQLPSPPGRPLSSPTSSLNFPSPTTSSQYGGTPQGVNLPLPTNLHQSTTSTYLPPIGSSRSPDSALRDHSAALQHEVSVQKLALSSLQGEHDKLLAAFSRSQLRATTLEKKHAVSDNEIISLTEEKLRLQTQVTELERDVDELSRSRDEFRQAAVLEGAQYVEIVKKASRLEEMAGEERKQWNQLKENMERRIEALTASRSRRVGNSDGTSTPENITLRRIVDEMDTDTPGSSVDLAVDLKNEPMTDGIPLAPTSMPANTQQESATDLKEEIRRLRERCIEVENALQAIRDDSRSMDGLVRSLLSRADSTLRA